MLLEEVQEQGRSHLRDELEMINRTAAQMMAQINECLDALKLQDAPSNPLSLERRLRRQTSQIVAAAETLMRKTLGKPDDLFRSDLSRIVGAARQAEELARTSLPGLFQRGSAEITAPMTTAEPVAHFLPPEPDLTPDVQTRKEGSILVVDDLEENRELLLRRLSRLGYSVQLVDSGQRALECIAANPADLILLDILMPGLNGVEVLQRLKADPRTRHIPVIMLSSSDQVDTVVSCITLGADDFLPKPFNATLLMARIESSLAKKRLRDGETKFLKRLQAEQDTSERLLLNILPGPIAERLKQGEKNIADSFAEATVLFSDFVDFTKLSAGLAPKVLVGRLNEIFSAFDQLCERHGLEKIKMIGDGYMAVSGLPTPRADHAQAAANLALAMQGAVEGFEGGNGQPFRIRIGLNSGPVVAGVIGTKKFAYDLWGDTVNMASRMQAHAPVGGILVTAPTYQRLRKDFSFKTGRLSRVKGKGEVLTYLLLGKLQPRKPSDPERS